MLKTILFLSLTTMGYMEQKSLEVNQKEKQYRCKVSCGTCMFHMEGKGCKLAVKIDTTYYFVEGAGIDDFGDAHATDGFCNAIKKAKEKKLEIIYGYEMLLGQAIRAFEIWHDMKAPYNAMKKALLGGF